MTYVYYEAEDFSGIPSFDELRRAEKQHGERILLTDLGILCANTDSQVRDRFAADSEDRILCWDCALNADVQEETGNRVNTDPSKATIS